MHKETETVELLRSVFDKSPDSIVLTDSAGRVLYINPAGTALAGLPQSPAGSSLSMRELFGGSEYDDLAQVVVQSGQWCGPGHIQHGPTGQQIPVQISAFAIEGTDDKPITALIVRDYREVEYEQRRAAVDALEYRAAEQQAVAELSKLALDGKLGELLEAATAAASTLMGVNRSMITRISPSDADLLTVEAFAGKPPRPPHLPAGTWSLMGYSLLTNEVVICEDRDYETRFSTVAMASYGFRSGVCVPIPAGAHAWGALSVHSVKNRVYTDRDIAFLQTVTGILSAAIRRLDLDRQLHERSMRDALTGLPNRAHAYECIDASLARANSAGTTMAVLLIDIDDFKIINDSLGHDAGDLALIRFAERLVATTRPDDTVARLGGDEFLVVCDGIVGADDVAVIARTLTDAIGRAHVFDKDPAPLSASIGVAISDRTTTRQELIRRADLAMYRAKETGLGGHAVFDQSDVYDAERTRALSVDLRTGLSRGNLTLVYQPLVDLTTGAIDAMEALARWEHPTLGAIGPSEFIAIAERTGLVGELGEWALQTACEQAASWREFTDVGIRVNVSALQLRDPAFVSQVAEILARTGLDPASLGLEITETVWVSDTARVAGTLSTLHEMGVKIVLDDLGSGHSSINYLRRYPVFDCFKIDKSFISDLPGTRPEAMVSAMVMLARAFDVTCVGEGVETAAQLDALRRCGCDVAQGFLLGLPIAADKAMSLLMAGVSH
ncbi:EAL domain-containing protein [Antrihabitans spumae]|uniref:EAL domain-containing protein n=1 Tax=Antrihabitans spumae TaxID=3373370 RepID=A0ABW7KUB6_9NOCA